MQQMSIKDWEEKVWASDLDPKAKMTALVLVMCYDPKEGCHPSFDELSHKTSLPIPAVKKCIKTLEDKGFIKVRKVKERIELWG